MDFSEKYILMCEKAKELRKKWKPEIGDWMKWYDKIIILNFKSSINAYYHFVDKDGNSGVITLEDMLQKESIPIWRQDQLQEIITEKEIKQIMGLDYRSKKHIDLYWSFRFWFEKRAGEEYIQKLDSFEQLWLAFIMFIKYNKVWNDKKSKWDKTNAKF